MNYTEFKKHAEYVAMWTAPNGVAYHANGKQVQRSLVLPAPTDAPIDALEQTQRLECVQS